MLVRRIGLLVLALGFFLFWTLVYLGVWWWHPATAFTGLGPHPYFSDFFYYAVSTAFISPPGDILAHTARSPHSHDDRDRDGRGAAVGVPRVLRRPRDRRPSPRSRTRRRRRGPT